MRRLALALLFATAPLVGAPIDLPRLVLPMEEQGLAPENLAYDPATGRLFLGSTARDKVVVVTPDGVARDFVASGAHGLWTVYGLKVDAARRSLWVASAESVADTARRTAQGERAGLFEFDLASGALRGRWLLHTPGVRHLLNDLVIAADGAVFVTQTFDQGQVYRLDPVTRRFEVFHAGGEDFGAPNGITITPDGRHLYVSHRRALSRIDLATGARSVLTMAPGIEAFDPRVRTWVDGLYWHRGALVALYPGGSIMRYTLDPTGLHISAATELARSNPLFTSPVTGVLAGDDLYFVGNRTQSAIFQLPLAGDR